MHKGFLFFGAIFGGLAVALGAFGAHGLEQLTLDEKILQGFRTGVQYQIYHSLTLMVLGILIERFKSPLMLWAGKFFIAGIILFCGSLYLLTFLKINGSGLTRFAGPLTPLGGICFIAGWLFLFAGLLKRKESNG
jgi:uncharacterized membrane protein YgdD (TMEM256/DUF423 family)